MTRQAKTQTLAALRDIWNRRDVPAIPDEELSRLTDGALTDLVQFWHHKDKNWDRLTNDEDVPSYTGSQTEVTKLPAAGKTTRGGLSNVDTRERQMSSIVFYTTGGGFLTPRQSDAMKLKETC